MLLSVRTAVRAVASCVAILGTLYAGPSLAWDTPSAVTSSSSFDDLAASPAPAAFAPAFGATMPAAEAAAAASVKPETSQSPAPRADHRSLAALVAEHSSANPSDAEQECLAGAVYFESKGEPLSGQLSVAEVVLNRARSGRFPGSVCGVVKQRGQFSFIRAGRFPPIARASAAWRKAVAIARIAAHDLADGAAPKALFFHARRVSPGWRGLTRIAAVGNHVFYR